MSVVVVTTGGTTYWPGPETGVTGIRQDPPPGGTCKHEQPWLGTYWIRGSPSGNRHSSGVLQVDHEVARFRASPRGQRLPAPSAISRGAVSARRRRAVAQ